jgi:hypothetical protein
LGGLFPLTPALSLGERGVAEGLIRFGGLFDGRTACGFVWRHGRERNRELALGPCIASVSGARVLTARGDACPTLWFGAVGMVVDFGEGLGGDKGEEFFQSNVAQIDLRGLGSGSTGLAFGFGFFRLVAFHEFSGEANSGDVFVENGVVRAKEIEVLFFDFAEKFFGKTALFVFERFGDVRAFDPFAEFQFFLFR